MTGQERALYDQNEKACETVKLLRESLTKSEGRVLALRKELSRSQRRIRSQRSRPILAVRKFKDLRRRFELVGDQLQAINNLALEGLENCSVAIDEEDPGIDESGATDQSDGATEIEDDSDTTLADLQVAAP